MADIPADSTSRARMDGADGGTEGFFVEIGSFSGTLEKSGDHDWIRIEVSSSTYHFYCAVQDRGNPVNGSAILYLRQANGDFIASGSPAVGGNVALTYAMTAGTYFLEVYTPGGPVSDYSLFATRLAAADKLLSDGADSYTGLAGERILGGKGNDTLNVGAGVDALGEQGNDNLNGGASFCRLSGGLGNDTLKAGTGGAFMFGDAGNDRIIGSAVADALFGGKGKDILRGGGDSDQFHFVRPADTPGSARDVIKDFTHGVDLIDLSAIDAKSGVAGDQHFNFIGTAHFHHHKGELHVVKVNNRGTAHDRVIVEGDVNGDGKADFQIELRGLHKITAGDFDL